MRALFNNPSSPFTFDSLVRHVDSVTKHVKQNKVLAGAVALVAGAVFVAGVYCAWRSSLKGKVSQPPTTGKGPEVPRPTPTVTLTREDSECMNEFKNSVEFMTNQMQLLKDFVKGKEFIAYMQGAQGRKLSNKTTPPITQEAESINKILNSLNKLIQKLDGLLITGETKLKRLIGDAEIEKARRQLENGKKLANACAHIYFFYNAMERSSDIDFKPPYPKNWNSPTERNAVQREALNILAFDWED